MEFLDYKGYVGSIGYDTEDNYLYGEVLGLPDNICIIYEGDTAEELYDDFKNGVDHYLEDCEEEGKQPQNPYNVLNIQIPSETHIRMAMYAKNHGTSINTFVRNSIERQLETV
jgi:predicted HicB family RNase H-like nuclease